ncbi:hypothetical protein [Halobaculum gomorrense]|uniref:STAS domain-containing protein n=1 Tax=Halobaculum gomorrense TaxID=43928 RepID=A0A1M5U5K2_9EURY|nr:hypothetical protein [Halobaculum gomorrense]SHH57983.1 hypothetical protein SAMN05443636_2917 [Halobaculum gomorrense]
MSSTTPQDPSPHVDRSRDGRLLRVELVGEFETRDVLAAMACARHLAEGCDEEFGVLVDVREFDAAGSALAALGEWETFLRMAGATTVIRVGDDDAVGGADRRAASVEEAERMLSG